MESSAEIDMLFRYVHALFSDNARVLVLSHVLSLVAEASLPVVPLALGKPFLVDVSHDPR
jgi:hypothetical protein